MHKRRVLAKAVRRAVLAVASILALLARPVQADDLTFLVHAPTKPSPHPPLVVLMHGAGADERDMISMWHDLPDDVAVVSVRAPFRQGGGFVWYRKEGGVPRPSDLALSGKIVDLVTDAAVKRFDADPRRLFIGGFSQGGVMTYQLALHAPQKYRGAIVLSGLLFPAALAGAGSAAPPFFIAHGTIDTRIPYAAAAKARDTLTRRGVSVSFHAYPGMGHGTQPDEMHDLEAWVTGRLREGAH